MVQRTTFLERPSSENLDLGHPFLTKNEAAPVGRRFCFCFEIWGDRSSQLSFLALWVPKCKKNLSRKVNTVFGEDEGISDVSATASYSILLQERRRDTQGPKPHNWKSSNYRVVEQ